MNYEIWMRKKKLFEILKKSFEILIEAATFCDWQSENLNPQRAAKIQSKSKFRQKK